LKQKWKSFSGSTYLIILDYFILSPICLGSDHAIMKDTKQKRRNIYLCNHTGEGHTEISLYMGWICTVPNTVLPSSNLYIPAETKYWWIKKKPRSIRTFKCYVYCSLHHCDSCRIKDQLDVTCYFVSLLMCSTCFGY